LRVGYIKVINSAQNVLSMEFNIITSQYKIVGIYKGHKGKIR
jgi:hypothetical protein